MSSTATSPIWNHSTSDDTEQWIHSQQEYVEHEKNYWAVILLVLCVFVVFGNVLVILSVARERTLKNMTNFFIVSLAVADLLVAGFVMPFSVYVLVNWGMWGLPKVVCDFYIALDVICSTSSIFNLVAVSIDRYYAVTAPISYSQHKDKHSRVYIIIVFCWVASIAIGSPIMLGANHVPMSDAVTDAQLNATFSEQSEFVCAFYNPDFIIYSSLGSFYIPCIVMIFLYGRIFKTLHQRAVQAKKAKKRTPMPSNNPDHAPSIIVSAAAANRLDPAKKLLSSETSFNDANVKSTIADKCNDDEPSPLSEAHPAKPNMVHKACGPDTSLYDRVKPRSAVLSYDDAADEADYKVQSSLATHLSVAGGADSRRNCASRTSPSEVENHLATTSAFPPEDNGSDQPRKTFKHIFVFYKSGTKRAVNKNKKKEKSTARKEKKATKTLAIVLGCFLVCWVPFFTCNIINAICIKIDSTWHPGDTAFLITTWLGYINSCVNPVIYTIFNPEFRKAFKKILGLGH